jgi:DNA transposition AAA+ family ATPase
VTAEDPSAQSTEFIITREHRRFVEFCDACLQARYIGLCYGVAGVGKTVSARRYSQWDELEALLGPAPHRHGGVPPRDSGPWGTVLYTPGVVNTPRTIQREVDNLWGTVSGLAARSEWYAERDVDPQPPPPDLVIVDEADRLKTSSLEQLRDLYDRRHIGLVLIGMPGLQKRLGRYAQLYSRVGFVHQFQPLSGRELQHVIERRWVQLSLDTPPEDEVDAAVVNAIARITGGNFRLLQRLFAEIERVLTVNGLSTVTTEVVAFAREALVVGPS